MTLAYDAMVFAREIHKNQVRKYTGNPYSDHLAEVAGIVAAIYTDRSVIAVAWLHDCIEDHNVSLTTLVNKFGVTVATGVRLLSDLETGNRALRKQWTCERLAQSPAWVQDIKCADLISNTSSIVQHDPDFAIVYLKEKKNLLDAMTKADRRLWDIAYNQIKE